ncbi:MAG: metal-dependent transcriptional regulator [Bacteroidetes bacterium]|nr:metal-dependent transcriptional regulator [Bacteroidota bacterium]
MNSFTEENYLKEIFKLMEKQGTDVSTNAIAEKLGTKAASVTDMLKKLSDKKLIHYKKYQGVSLSAKGKKVALEIIRNHRLWEVFLVNKLQFKWDEVHEMAEELEHINSKEMVLRLDKYLGYPKFDPHGDPIPDENGKLGTPKSRLLSQLNRNQTATVIGVTDHSTAFLQYIAKLGITLGNSIKMKEQIEYDKSLSICINNKITVYVSHEVAKNILITA